MNEPTPTKALINELDQRLTAMAESTQRLPPDIQAAALAAVAATRAELRAITTPEQVGALAEQYRNAPHTDPVTTGLRTQLLGRFDAHLRSTLPGTSTVNATVNTTVQRPEPSPVATAPDRSTQPAVARSTPASVNPTPAAPVAAGVPANTATPQARSAVPAVPASHGPAPSPQPGIRPGDLVVFRNGEQNRWGIIDHRPRDSAFVVRVSGIPHTVPAVNITHTIDPRQQPDLPLDSVLDGERLRVRRVHWGDDAERLQALAKGRPPMRRLGHVTDGLDLRDGIGTNNERAEPSTRRDDAAHDRSDQQPDVQFVRSNPGRTPPTEPPADSTIRRLPTAGPNAMRWAANLDDAQPGQTRIIVAGSRDLNPDSYDVIKTTLQRELGNTDPAKITIVHGAARGADQLAAQAARQLGMRVEGHRADWDTHGKAAGPIRNQQMLDSGAQRLIAFVDKPLDQSRGTADMIRRARNAGMATTVINTSLAPSNRPTAPTPVSASPAPAVAPPVRALR